MNLNKKSLILISLLTASMSLVSCKKAEESTNNDNKTNNNENKTSEESKTTAETYVKADRTIKVEPKEVKLGTTDDELYDENLKEFYDLLLEAENEKVTNMNERHVRMAKAEARLLDSAVFLPINTQGGNYALTRIAPRTVPYTFTGTDDSRLKNMVLTKGGTESIIKSADRAALLEQWGKAVKGNGTYDPAKYLTEKGYQLNKEYVATFSTAPKTTDLLKTSLATDSEPLADIFQGLVEYDNLGNLNPTSGQAWTVSNDGKTYTFTVPENLKWVNHEGNETNYGNVTAQDFVDGLHHLLDAQNVSEYIVSPIVENAAAYAEGKELDFSKVGIKADGNKVIYSLVRAEPFFPTRLAYSMFSPLKKEFFEEKGGVFGVEAYKAKSGTNEYSYGKANSPESMIYCGAFYLSEDSSSNSGGSLVLKRNTHFINNEKTTLDKVTFVYDAGNNPEQTYESFKKGDISGLGLTQSSGNIDRAKKDGIYDDNKYIVDTTATTFFGGLNLNRQTFDKASVHSKKSEAQKEFWAKAVQSKNIRKAIVHGIDKAAYNAITVGDDIKNLSLRNMYTAPDFASLTEDVTLDGHTFPKGSSYGDICQYYCNQLGVGVDVHDAVDGWYNPEAAKKFLAQGKEDLKKIGVEWDNTATLEWVCLESSVPRKARSNAWKENFNKLFEGLGIAGDLLNTSVNADYSNAVYNIGSGAENASDIYCDSGWTPDYKDASSYLDTFMPAKLGYMTRVVGLY